MSQARVTSIPPLEAFRAALAEFLVDAQDALSGAEADIRRTENWLQEQQKHWQREIRKRTEEVQRAKNELAARKYQNRDGKGLGSTDQEKALKKAQLRLEEAETKLANCRRWAPQLHHAIHEYHGPARLLAGALETEGVNALAVLGNKLAALEAYLNVAVPMTTPPAPEGTSEPEMASAAMPTEEAPAPVSAVPSEDSKDEQS